ncbi:MAG: hypothetical protein EB127_29370, partial [Alphaproteobacteria bacterium]|nr:hypothetical protein [Alphaproteobacteria bacterium]
MCVRSANKVPNFINNSAQAAIWLPSYVDSADLEKDILGNSRSEFRSAIGANDKESNYGFYGQDILSIPLEDITSADCGIDPLFDVIQRKIDLWYPKYRAGYFYSYDRPFYLYSKKRCSTLGSLCQTEFILPSRIDTNSPIELIVNGSTVKNKNYYDAAGDRFILYHLNLPINTLNEEIEIKYSVTTWSDAGFISTPTSIRFKIKEGITRYFLEKDYIPGAPVVITDDMSSPTDKDLYSNREYSITFDQTVQKSEIIFAQNSNKVLNSQFDYSLSGTSPLYWSSDRASITTGSSSLYPVCGSFMCAIQHTGYIQQILPTHSGESVLSFYGATTGSANITYSLSFFDDYNR